MVVENYYLAKRIAKKITLLSAWENFTNEGDDFHHGMALGLEALITFQMRE